MRTAVALLSLLVWSGCGPAEIESEDSVLDLESVPVTDEEFDLSGTGDPDELAVIDSELTRASVRCQGPYNCTLPNPRPANEACGGRNRLRNPASADHGCLFGVAPSAHLRDGNGNIRGVLADGKIKINYGQRKKVANVNHVYAFAARMQGGVFASGWVREGALDRGSLSFMPTVRARDPGQGFYQKLWLVTGGDPNRYGELKVAPNIPREANVKASDYLLRPGNVVNFLYSLPGVGGVSIDTVPSRSRHFRRAKGVAEVRVPLYHPNSSVRVGSMPFIYGRLGGRFGWIARDALE